MSNIYLFGSQMTEAAFVHRTVDAEEEGGDGVLQERVTDRLKSLEVDG